MKRFAVLLILTVALPLAAKVYWPGTGRGVASGSPRRSFAEESGARHQMTEPVIFNGVSAEVHVYRLPRNLTQFLEELHRRYPELVIRKNAGGMLLRPCAGAVESGAHLCGRGEYREPESGG